MTYSAFRVYYILFAIYLLGIKPCTSYRWSGGISFRVLLLQREVGHDPIDRRTESVQRAVERKDQPDEPLIRLSDLAFQFHLGAEHFIDRPGALTLVFQFTQTSLFRNDIVALLSYPDPDLRWQIVAGPAHGIVRQGIQTNIVEHDLRAREPLYLIVPGSKYWRVFCNVVI